MATSYKSLAFKCHQCFEKFRTEDFVRVDFDERDFHPFDYLATCPSCAAENVKLEPWQINLFKAHINATGPNTAEGIKAMVTKKDYSYQKQFGALTHGLTAKVAQSYPARPGEYAACEGCNYLNDGCGDLQKACLKRTELFIRYRNSADSGDIKSLKQIFADNQAMIQGILEDMMLAIARTGVEVREPVFNIDKEGKISVAQVINNETGELDIVYEAPKAHPLLKPLIEMMSKNNLTLSDMMLTQKQQGEDAKLSGFLKDESENRDEARKRQDLYDQRQATMLDLLEKGSQAIPKNVLKLAGDK